MAERVRYEVFVGLDVGKGEHHACALDPDGKRLHDGCWPAVWTVEMFDGALQFGSAGDPKWDWRSVVMAARAYPGWRIALHDGFLLFSRSTRARGWHSAYQLTGMVASVGR